MILPSENVAESNAEKIARLAEAARAMQVELPAQPESESMTIGPLTHEAFRYIAHNMREWDRKEVFATQWTDDPEDLATAWEQRGPFSFVGSTELPICAAGGVQMWPGVWSMWLLATDEWPAVATSVTKFVKRIIVPNLWAMGAHRLECRAMEGHPSRAWLEWLGFEREATHHGYGKGKETFHTYVLTRQSCK